MAINFQTTNPRGLLAAYKKAIADGKVDTWSVDADGNFTHTPPQWKDQAILRPSVLDGWLIMNFYLRKGEKTSSALYAVYHGRFIESMLAHCDTLFTSGNATALPTNADRLTRAA